MTAKEQFSQLRFQCLRLMLRPIARFCLKHGTGIQEFLEVAKHSFVEQAASEIEESGDKANVSRISISTGIHRRDVMRIYGQGEARETPEGVAVRVIGQWIADKKFLTTAGKPRILSNQSDNNEYRVLVETVSKDVNPGSVLSELQRIGAVEKTARGIKLLASAFQSDSSSLEGYRIMAKDVENLMGAVDENLSSKSSVPNLHARTEYDNISDENLPEIRDWLLKEGSAFHKKVRKYLAGFDHDINPELNKSGGAKVVVGSFSQCSAPRNVED